MSTCSNILALFGFWFQQLHKKNLWDLRQLIFEHLLDTDIKEILLLFNEAIIV